jgi:hypothetical protein
MSRQRMIRPEFFDSESIGAVSPPARLLFIGLLVFSDDTGVHKAQVSRIRKEVFDYDDIADVDVVRMLAELEDVGCIEAHDSSAGTVITIPNFLTYQRINRPSKPTVEKVGKRLPHLFRERAEWFDEDAPPCGKPLPAPVENPPFSECSMSAHGERKKKGKKELIVLPPLEQCGASFPQPATANAHVFAEDTQKGRQGDEDGHVVNIDRIRELLKRGRA